MSRGPNGRGPTARAFGALRGRCAAGTRSGTAGSPFDHWSNRRDEERFGLEYDLDVYNIVAVSDFNMGGPRPPALRARVLEGRGESRTESRIESRVRVCERECRGVQLQQVRDVLAVRAWACVRGILCKIGDAPLGGGGWGGCAMLKR